MTTTKMEEVLQVIQDALNPQDSAVTFESTRSDIVEWDSLGHLGVIAALDKFFNGKVGTIREIATADSVQKIIQLLKDNELL